MLERRSDEPPCAELAVKHTLSYFEVKAGHDGQLLHGQLLGGLLVAMATAAFDLSTAAEVLWPGEPRQERMDWIV